MLGPRELVALYGPTLGEEQFVIDSARSAHDIGTGQFDHLVDKIRELIDAGADEYATLTMTVISLLSQQPEINAAILASAVLNAARDQVPAMAMRV